MVEFSGHFGVVVGVDGKKIERAAAASMGGAEIFDAAGSFAIEARIAIGGVEFERTVAGGVRGDMGEELVKAQVQAGDGAQLQAADFDLVGIVTVILESAEDGVGGVIVEPLQFFPIAVPPVEAHEVGFVEDDPGPIEGGFAVTFDDVAGDTARDLMQLGQILGGGPALSVDGQIPGSTGEAWNDTKAVFGMDLVPDMVEATPVVMRDS